MFEVIRIAYYSAYNLYLTIPNLLSRFIYTLRNNLVLRAQVFWIPFEPKCYNIRALFNGHCLPRCLPYLEAYKLGSQTATSYSIKSPIRVEV